MPKNKILAIVSICVVAVVAIILAVLLHSTSGKLKLTQAELATTKTTLQTTETTLPKPMCQKINRNPEIHCPKPKVRWRRRVRNSARHKRYCKMQAKLPEKSPLNGIRFKKIKVRLNAKKRVFARS